MNSSTSLAATLPDDIIHELYHAAAAIYPPRGFTDNRYAKCDALGWITLTHVCHRWRKIGTQISSLWAEILCVFPPDNSAILHRSKDQKLSLEVSNVNKYNYIRGTWPMAQAFHLLSRTQRLRFYLSSSAAYGKAWKSFVASPSLLHLTELHIEASFPSPFDGAPLEAPALRVFATNVYFPLNAPGLRVLDITGVYWYWQLLVYVLSQHPLLEQLCCEAVPGEPGQRLYYYEDAGKWDEMVINGCYVLAKELDISSPVVLAHMKTLQTCDKYADLSGLLQLLAHLDLPACTSLRVSEMHGTEWFLPLFARPEMCYPSRDIMAIYDKWVQEDEARHVRIRLTEGDARLELGDDEDGGIQLSTQLDPWIQPPEDVLDVLEAIGSDTAERIRVLAFIHDCDYEYCDGCAGTFDGTDFSSAALSLQRFTHVSELHLTRQGGYLLRILSSLCAPTSHTEWTFPALRTLVLELGDTHPREIWEQLRTMLASRRTEGRPVQRLVVRGSGACHPSDCLEDSDEWSIGSQDDADEYLVAVLKDRQITLDEERQLVAEVIDKREMLTCRCMDIWY